MRRLILAVSLLSAVPAVAMPFGTDSFRDAKSGYRVAVSYSGSTMLLDGYKPQDRSRFHLEVSPRGVVTGTFAGRPITYVMGSQAQAVALNTVP